MQQYQLKHRNGFDGLELVSDLEVPKITSPTQILIRIHAIALNARDLQIATSNYPAPHSIPERVVPVSDGAGEVVEVGAEVTRFSKGDKACPIVMQGHYHEPENEHLHYSIGGARHGVASQYFLCDQGDAVKFPSRLSYVEAATLPCAYVTSWTAVVGFWPKMKAGDWVLCMGTGGCSIALLQMAKAAGCKVIVSSSSDKKLDVAKSMGADYGVNYAKQNDWDQEIRKITNGRGVDFVLEVSGGDTLARSVRSVRRGGLVSIIGYLSDYSAKTGANEDMAKTIMYNQATVKGVIIGNRTQFEEMNDAIDAASFKPAVDKVFKFEELKAAYEYLANGSVFGKVVVEVP